MCVWRGEWGGDFFINFLTTGNLRAGIFAFLTSRLLQGKTLLTLMKNEMLKSPMNHDSCP